MLTTWLQALTLATAGVLVPGSLTILLLLLLSETRGQRNALGYALGYFSGYTLWAMLSVALGAHWLPAGGEATPPKALGWVFVALGGLLLALALRNARRPASRPAEGPPRLFTLLERVPPWGAAALGFFVTVLNFKNLGLFSSALAVVLFSDLSLPQKFVLALLVSTVFCSAVVTPALLVWLFPRPARQGLTRFKTWLTRHSRTLAVWAPLLFGLLILAKGMSWLR